MRRFSGIKKFYTSSSKFYKIHRMGYTVYRNDTPYCATDSSEKSGEIAHKLNLLDKLKTALENDDTETVARLLNRIKEL